MSLPKNLQQNFTPQEINFLAEQTPTTILPRYTMNGTQLISAKLPNLRALSRETLPLWLSIVLKKQDKCNIVIPDWLTTEYLKAKYQEELKFPNHFSKLPWHWLPISKKLLDSASDDFTDPPHEIRSFLQDLREIRLVKARKGIRELNEVYIQLDGLSLMEINEIRPFVLQVMDQLRKMNEATKERPDGGQDDEYEEGDITSVSANETSDSVTKVNNSRTLLEIDDDDESDDDIYRK